MAARYSFICQCGSKKPTPVDFHQFFLSPGNFPALSYPDLAFIITTMAGLAIDTFYWNGANYLTKESIITIIACKLLVITN